jgi:hypothetical protein
LTFGFTSFLSDTDIICRLDRRRVHLCPFGHLHLHIHTHAHVDARVEAHVRANINVQIVGQIRVDIAKELCERVERGLRLVGAAADGWGAACGG